ADRPPERRSWFHQPQPLPLLPRRLHHCSAYTGREPTPSVLDAPPPCRPGRHSRSPPPSLACCTALLRLLLLLLPFPSLTRRLRRESSRRSPFSRLRLRCHGDSPLLPSGPLPRRFPGRVWQHAPPRCRLVRLQTLGTAPH